MTGGRSIDGGAAPPDLRRAPLTALRAVDLRAPSRDFWADERALWDRLVAAWAGLDDAAWRLPGAAPSDAGGPDWSLLDHVAHLAHWQEVAIEYLGRAERTGEWPRDDDFDGGDFDRYNERQRAPWAGLLPGDVRDRLADGHERLVAIARRFPLATIRSDAAWSWVYLVLHGHQLDHLVVIEPWADALRRRQVDNDPFVEDPRPATGDDATDVGAFFAADASVIALFDDLVRPVPRAGWATEPVTEGWTLRDHVAHLADWFEEGAGAIEEHARTGTWRDGPAEGFDAWNARALTSWRTLTPDEVLARFDATLGRLRHAIRSMPAAVLRSDDGWSWAYECLHGHVRSHLAMVGPWCARVAWPAREEG